MKIEEVRQHDLKDCGACSLSCIIKFYGGYVPLEKIREDTYTNANGTTAYNLIKAAQNYGFEAVGYNVDDIKDKNLYFPSIVHLILKNGLNHFAVLYKVSNTHVYLMDPAQGKTKMKIEDFKQIWNHIILLFTPKSNNIVKYTKELKFMSLIMQLVGKYKKLFRNLIIISIFLMLLQIVSSFYFQVAVSSLTSSLDLKLIKFIVIFFLGICLFKIISNFIRNYYLNFISKNLDVHLFSDFLSHVFHLPLKFMENRTTGEVISRVEELTQVKNLIADLFTNLILNAILILGAIFTLYFISAKLFFILCIIIGIYIIGSLIFNKVIYQKIKENIEANTEFNSTLVEHINMFTSIKNLNLTSEFLKQLENKLILMLKNNFLFQKFLNIVDLFHNTVYELGLFGLLTYGFYLIYLGDMQVLTLVTFNSLIIYLFEPIKQLISLIPKYNYLKATFNKLSDFLSIPEEVEENGLKKIIKPSMQTNSLNYYYNTNKVLNNLNIKIEEKDKVFLTGPSGSGKSTLCKIIYRYLEDYKGKLTINNSSESDYSLKAIRQNILYVGQEEKLFTGTIKENITCFRTISDNDFLKVAKICKIEDIIAKKPNRYNTLINASLNNLSGGEKQRIILARALLKKSKILILDEALSEVNIELEKEIIQNILNNYAQQTIIYVSHKDVASYFNKVIRVGGINDGNI